MSKVTLNAGKRIPKELQDPSIPDGYVQLESIHYSLEREMYELVLDYSQSNSERVDDLLIKSSNCIVARYIDLIPLKISLIVPEDQVSLLTQEERDQLAPYKEDRFEIISRCPQLIRFIDKEYAEQFFKEGVLRLSSFEKCKTLEDQKRCDNDEGVADLIGKKEDYNIKMRFGIGSNPFLLCASYFMSTPEEIKNADGTVAGESGIIIKNPDEFVKQVFEALIAQGLHITNVLWGPCHYSNKTITKQLVHEPKLFDKKSFDAKALIQFANGVAGYDIFFEKSQMFKHEMEWRFVFICEEEHPDTIDIQVKQPNLFCGLYLADDIM